MESSYPIEYTTPFPPEVFSEYEMRRATGENRRLMTPTHYHPARLYLD
jgi:hypothetical protein